MKRYPEYKDSGVGWMGGIPINWRVSKLKFITNKIVDGTHITPTYVDEGIPFLRVTDLQNKEIDLNSCKYISELEHEALTKRNKPEKGDILLSKNGTIGITKVVDWDFPFSFFVSICLIKFKFESIKPEYFGYFFQSNIVNVQIFESIKTTSVTNLHLDKINELLTFIPTISEQISIIDYLDHKTQKIDELIAKKETLIELLKEQRAAVINHAVTKGLDTHVKMKDSGIPWLGEIPEHWEIRKLKTIAKIITSNLDKKTIDSEKKVFLCNYLDVYKNDFITDQIDFMIATANDNEIEYFKLKQGDVIITKDSESWDDIAIPAFVQKLSTEALCAYHLALIRPNHTIIDGEYLFRSFCANSINYQFRISANGITRYGLSQHSIKNALLIIPPITEQQTIVKYLNNKTRAIDSILDIEIKAIVILKEYRKALISDAVTGKIDVRGFEP